MFQTHYNPLKYYSAKIFIQTIVIILATFQLLFAQFEYVNPLPGSGFHNPQTTIILKNGSNLNPESVSDHSFIKIKGSESGNHSWSAKISDDNKSVLVKPDEPFYWSETVYVEVLPVLQKENSTPIDGMKFNFKIRDEITSEKKEQYRQIQVENLKSSLGYDPYKGNDQQKPFPPDGMPTFKINVNNNPSPGSIFYSNQDDLYDNVMSSFPTIIQNDGTVIWTKNLGIDGDGHDFKINQNGYLTYFKYSTLMWMVMDSNFNLIDSIQCGNGYEYATNPHDIQMYPDGHTFLIAYDIQTIDMTPYGGVPDAEVTGLIIQELDADEDVVFEWRSWDHFQFTDANSHVSLTNLVIDYVHGNSVCRDVDENVLISCRNMDEITKINHANGNIIWRMGGDNNQFTFVNDNLPQHFSQQHDARRIANGHITLFNNGNHLPVQVSTAKEYAVDEVNKIATLIWYYEHPDVNGQKVYGRATGNMQRLPNGNTMINWGTIWWDFGIPNMTEVDANKNIVWEMTFDSAGQSYRTFKFDWNPCSRITGYTMKVNPKPTTATLSFKPATGAHGYKVNYRKLGTSTWSVLNTSKLKLGLTGLSPSTSYEWKVKSICSVNPMVGSAFSVIDTFTTPPMKYLAEDNESPAQVNIYPVPAQDDVIVEIPSTLETITLLFVNSLGSIVYETSIAPNAIHTVNVDVSQWPAGLYTAQLVSSGQITMRKIIVD